MNHLEVMLASETGDVLKVRIAHPAGTPNPLDREAFLAYYNEAKVAALHAAFDLVKPSGNWKGPINAVAPANLTETIVEAVAFMGGGEAKVKPVSPGLVRIIAPGYYKASGA